MGEPNLFDTKKSVFRNGMIRYNLKMCGRQYHSLTCLAGSMTRTNTRIQI